LKLSYNVIKAWIDFFDQQAIHLAFDRVIHEAFSGIHHLLKDDNGDSSSFSIKKEGCSRTGSILKNG
jgi:hypothetical protein